MQLGRPNMAERKGEAWKPYPFVSRSTKRARLAAFLRRFLDLQAASIWKDLAVLMPQCRGLVLDVGCGAQPYRGLLGPEAQYQGIDHVLARETFDYDIPGTLYYSGDRWPVADSTVDVILSTETIEHLRDPDAFFREAFRCLRPGGNLVLTVPFAARWHYIPHDYWRFTPSALVYMLNKSGLSDVKVYARGNAATVACYKLMALFLKLLLPQGQSRMAGWGIRLLGLPFVPFVLAFAILAHLSLRGSGGDDCLGYTVLASK